MQKWTPAWIVGVALVTAGIGLAGTALTGTLPEAFTPNALASKTAASGAPNGDVLETFKGDVDPSVTQGVLDLRIFRGNIHVIAWDKPAYEIAVWQYVEGDNTQLGDGDIEIQFEETKKDGLGLFLTVTPTGTADILLNGHRQLGVVAYVPNIAWETAYLCSGLDDSRFSIFDDNPVWQNEDTAASCVTGERPVSMGITLGNPLDENKGNRTSLDIPFSVEGIHGKDLTLAAEYANLAVKDVAFETAILVTEYGNIAGSIIAAKLGGFTEYGNVKLVGNVDDAALATEYGNIALQIVGGSSGAIQAFSEYGNIKILLPKADAKRGYDVTGMTEYGRVKIDLSDAEKQEPVAEDDGETATGTRAPGLLGLQSAPAPGPSKSSRHHNDEAMGHAVSKDFDAKKIKVSVEAVTQYGSIFVTDLAKSFKTAEKDEGDEKA